ncbi:unnamed protein product [Macrosiphum euphorbiae]|uniref:Uncharacterized protein n=1 Tax=Macrosiphum euphorbiae TaxID=13131 RepID=A0AAV0XEE0_9HEMI|nr:unnamed protein product [Macrosiphum euphorbiae]
MWQGLTFGTRKQSSPARGTWNFRNHPKFHARWHGSLAKWQVVHGGDVRQRGPGGIVRRGGHSCVGQLVDADGRSPVSFGHLMWGGRYPFFCGASS